MLVTQRRDLLGQPVLLRGIHSNYGGYCAGRRVKQSGFDIGHV